MELAESTYYADPKRSYKQREEEEADLRGKIEQIRVTFPRAGYRMLQDHLRRAGVKVGERKLRNVLIKFDLHVKPKRKFIATTDSNHAYEVHPNLLPELTVDGTNQVWTADITYIRILTGFVYLAVVLDLYSRKVIGWAISKRIDGDLALNALEMAIISRDPSRGVFHHSDRGVQYLCDKYVKRLNERGFHISCSAKGNPYDNAWTESFMKTLKYDEIYMYEYETFIDVITRVPYFIEEVYNKRRPHSSLGYATPVEFEEAATKSVQENSIGRPSFKL